TPVINEVELPGEAKPADGNRPQLLGGQLSLHAEPGEERDSETVFHGILDARVAAEFERDAQAGQRSSHLLKALLQGTAGARARLTDDERLADQGGERDGSPRRPSVPRGDDKHKGIAADGPTFEARPLGLLAYEPERCFAPLDLDQHGTAVAHRGPDMDL